MIVFFDADTLLNLAQDPTALRAVADAVGGGCRVTTTVVSELTASVRHQPPVPNARRALGAAQAMQQVDLMDVDLDVQDRALRLRDSVAANAAANPHEAEDKISELTSNGWANSHNGADAVANKRAWQEKLRGHIRDYTEARDDLEGKAASYRESADSFAASHQANVDLANTTTTSDLAA